MNLFFFRIGTACWPPHLASFFHRLRTVPNFSLPHWGRDSVYVIFSRCCLHKIEAGRRTSTHVIFCFFLGLLGNMLMPLEDSQVMTNLGCGTLAHYDGAVSSHLPLLFSSQTLPNVFPTPSTKSPLRLFSIWETRAYSCRCIWLCSSVILTARKLIAKYNARLTSRDLWWSVWQKV